MRLYIIGFLTLMTSFLMAQCQIEFDGNNEDGQKTVVVEEDLFFTYTDPRLEDMVDQREFLQASVSAMKIQSKAFLRMRINMATERASQFYGEITVGQPVKFLFIDRDPTFLNVVYTTLPKQDAKKSTTEYEIMLELSNKNEKALRKCELDALGIVWTSGYEEYPIYDVDFIRNQLQCLKKRS